MSNRAVMRSQRKGMATEFSLSELLYYVAFVCYCLWQGFGNTTFESLLFINMSSFQRFMQVIVLLCLAFRIVLQHYNLRSLAILVVVGAVIFVGSQTANINTVFYAFLFIAAGRGINLRRLACISLIVSVVLLTVTTAFASAGVIEDLTVRESLSRSARHSMGFVHPNRFGLVLFQIAVSWLVLRYPKFKIIDLLVTVAAAAAAYLVADSRTIVLSIALFAVALIAAKLLDKHQKFNVFVVCVSLGALLVMIASAYFMVSYNSGVDWQAALDEALSRRLRYAHYYYDLYTPTIWGNDFKDAPIITMSDDLFQSRMLIDNMYARLFIRYGLAVTAVLFIGFAMLAWRMFKKNKFDIGFVCLSIFAIIGFSEATLLDFSVNYFAIAFVPLIYEWGLTDQQTDEASKREQVEKSGETSESGRESTLQKR